MIVRSAVLIGENGTEGGSQYCFAVARLAEGAYVGVWLRHLGGLVLPTVFGEGCANSRGEEEGRHEN